MGWQDFVQKDDSTVTLPWVGGRELRSHDRAFNIVGKLPPEPGWHTFRIQGRKAFLLEGEEARLAAEWGVEPPGPLHFNVTGYLVGDRFIPDSAAVDPDPAKIAGQSERIWLVEDGLERFTRVEAGRAFEDGPLIYARMSFPLGPEDEVARAFQDRASSVAHIKGVVPALDAAFRMETWRRAETERLRREAEERRRREEEQRLLEERRREIAERLGDGAGRRAMAALDFEEAARAALAVGGAEYLDSRRSRNRGEMVVTFRLGHRRFECTCDRRTLQVIDSGICLVDHATGEKGDSYFTLESLPAVIIQADRERRLVVFRHVDEEDWDD